MPTAIDPYALDASPLLVVISGPSGVGKDAVINRIKELGSPLHFVITATDRPKRPAEVDGRDYFFISTADFERMIEEDELLEYAVVYENYKGVPKAQIREALASGQDVIMRVDVQGAKTIREIVPGAVLIYLSAESESVLTNRLRERNTDSEEQLETRLATLMKENEQIPFFDYLVINAQGKIDQTCKTIATIIKAEKCRINRPEVSL